ncbi:MAG: DEAD/DEAH box helicase, partial [Myxococcales bacterium]|nr:DEAD/DEAH box helicase [Myxococcales bacterium]
AAPAADSDPDDVATQPVRPRLRAELDRDHGDRVAVRVVAEARYGDAVFELATWDPARPWPRDLVAEGRLHERLQGLLATLPHGGQATSSLELLADARHLAHAVVPTLLAEGWACELAEDFPHEAPLVDVTFVEHLRPRDDGRDWFGLELGVTIAGRTVPLLPILLQAIRDGQLVVEPGGGAAQVGGGLTLQLPEGELVHVPAERVQRWLRPLVELELNGISADGVVEMPAFVAAELDGEAAGRFGSTAALTAARERLAALLALAPRKEGRGFAGTLRPYQRVGLAWLRFLHDAGYGGLLADEMGLGKTVQLLAFLDGLRAAGKLTAAAPALVVAPRSVVGNWHREATRFAPRLRPTIHLGADRAQQVDALASAPLIVTSYQTLLRDLELFRAVGWTTVLCDEAQAVKNADTQLRGAVAALRAHSRFCITGTPIENHLGELWSQLDLAMPGLLGRRAAFDAIFRRPIEKFGAIEPLERLRARIRPFLLRRTKESVELDLPPKTEVVEYVDLDTAQRDLYESLRLTLDDKVRKALIERGIQGTSMMILDALLKLRQCCCDPRLLDLPQARELDASAKLERLMGMLEELVDSERSTLVFSQFTSMLALIEQACDQAGIPCVTLTGATRDRDDVIRRFQDGEVPVFLISLKAGGVGLNLTRADTVIHYDPWWNPAAEQQASDRAHRIGQTRPVMVYKLVARGTLEETICQMQDDKRELTAAALRDGGVTHLAADDLESLYRRLI